MNRLFAGFLAKGLFFIALIASLPLYSAEENYPTVCLSSQEWHMYREINVYRRNVGLPAIPVSSALTRVAQAHAEDLSLNHPDTASCNMHSWSENGSWSSCCYTSDHSESECMWNKPKELSNYSGAGYEISFWSSAGSDTPEFVPTALSAWKRSSGHNSVMINLGSWNSLRWKAIGIGIKDGYACVWFGEEKDTSPAPARCLP